MRVLQALLMSAAILLLMDLFAGFFGPRTGRLAGALMAANPVLAKADVFIENTALAIFLSALAFRWLWNARDSERIGTSAAAGAGLGLAGLANPTFLTALPWAMALLFAKGRRWRPPMVLAAATLLVLLPWALRNRAVFHRWIPVTDTFPIVLWEGNNPNATGGLTLSDGRAIPVPEDLLAATSGLDEAEVYRKFGKEAIAFIRENPARFVLLRTKAYFYFWMTSRPWLGRGTAVDVVNVAAALLLLVTSAAGLWTAARSGTPGWAFWPLFFLGFSAIYGLTHADVIDRYRLPLDPYLTGFSALFLARMRERRASPKTI
jgi:4-amino-4-deoxy-L-arabinose transferase-like glycosyltransferase